MLSYPVKWTAGKLRPKDGGRWQGRWQKTVLEPEPWFRMDDRLRGPCGAWGGRQTEGGELSGRRAPKMNSCAHCFVLGWPWPSPPPTSVRPLSHCSSRGQRSGFGVTRQKPPLPGWPKVIAGRVMWQTCYYPDKIASALFSESMLKHGLILHFPRMVLFRFFALIIYLIISALHFLLWLQDSLEVHNHTSLWDIIFHT